MGKINYTVIQINKPSSKALSDFNKTAYSFIEKQKSSVSKVASKKE